MNERKDLETVTIEEAAEALGVSRSKVTRYIEDNSLLVINKGGQKKIPADLIVNGAIITSMRGTVMLLLDLGLDYGEVIDWIFTHNDDLRETPIAALTKGHKAPVRRAAQLLAESY